MGGAYRVKCPNCHQIVDADGMFCPECGYDLRKMLAGMFKHGERWHVSSAMGTWYCSRCGAAMRAGVERCPACGSDRVGPKK